MGTALKWLAAVAVLAVGAWAMWHFGARDGAPPGLCEALQSYNVVRSAGEATACEGVDHVRLDRQPRIADALAGEDPEALAEALRVADVGAVVVSREQGSTGSLAARMAAYAYMPALQAVYLHPSTVVYAPAPQVAPSAQGGHALAVVARGMLLGAREPRLRSFPPALRRVQQAEVMVLVRKGDQPRLWRSARGTTLAKALLTATRVARERWAERKTALGGSLKKVLPDLTVEVLWLREDGVVGSVAPPFVNQVVQPGQGVGIDYRNGWHYVLPRAVADRQGDAFQALEARLKDDGLPDSAVKDPDARLYRLVPVSLGVSEAGEGMPPAALSDSSSGVGEFD